MMSDKSKNRIMKAALMLVICIAVAAALCFPVFAEDRPQDTVTVDNGIPVVYINIDESQGTIYDMIDSVDHSVYCYGTISIVVPKGFHYSDFPDSVCESLEGLQMSIRGRGNSTWERSPKKPFKIKLDKKADFFGLGSNKHWVLLANYFDETLIRDRMTAWLGDEMGFAFTPRGVPVDLVISGEEYGTEYLGSYYLSENVRVGENRLEIDELEEGDTDPMVITGGYLIQNSYQVRKGSPDRFKTSRGAEWATHTPSFDTEEDKLGAEEVLTEAEGEESFAGAELADAYENKAQMEYIQNYVQYFEDVLFERGTAYRDLMDVESAAKYWLIQTFSLNGDAYATGSTYFYKQRDTEEGTGKICWGPLWDFDFAWDHQLLTDELAYGHEWIKPMLYDRGEGGFVDEIHKQWPVMKELLVRITEEGGILDRYKEETRASAESDRKIHFPNLELTYDEDVEELRDWIIRRIELVDRNIGLVDDMVHKVTYVVDGEPYNTVFMAAGQKVDGTEPYPEKEGYVFLGWADEKGSIINTGVDVTEDMTLTAKYLSDAEATHGSDIAFGVNSDVMKYNVHIFMYQIPYTVIPEDAMDRAVEWSSSNEEWATVDQDGMVTFNGAGSAVFTAKLRFGQTRQFTLTISEADAPYPVSIKPAEKKIKLKTGQQGVLTIIPDPDPAAIDNCTYESEDESVVTVGDYGVLTAVGPGRTKVKVTAVTYDGDGNEIVNETQAVVIVSGRRIGAAQYVPYAAAACAVLLAAVAAFFIARRKKNGR